MKSIQVARTMKPAEQKDFSDLQVLKSAAGWYIGTIFTDPKDGFKEPGSRDSGYFKTEEDAKLALELLERLNKSLTGTAGEQMLIGWSNMLFLLGLDDQEVGYRMTP